MYHKEIEAKEVVIVEFFEAAGEKAKSNKTSIMRTGTRRRGNGGGGKGGKTIGKTSRNSKRTTNNIPDFRLK